MAATAAPGLATLKVARTIANGGMEADQAEMSLFLPPGAAATGLRIKGKDAWYDGELMEAGMASVVYESLTGYGPWDPRDPALLFWLDTGNLGLFVFPVNPKSQGTVEYTLLVPLAYRDGRYYMKYPADVQEDELAVPSIAVAGAKGLVVNGVKTAAGAAVAAGPRLISGEEAGAYGATGKDLCDDGEEGLGGYSWPEEGEADPSAFCRLPGEALVSFDAPPIDTLLARFGSFSLSGDRAAVRIEIDAAKTLRPKPKKATVVFVVDASRSWGRAGIDAALGLAGAFVSHLPDAKVEVVLFRRTAARLFGELAPAAKWGKLVGAAAKEGGALAPGNGSAMEEGLALAASIVKGAKGPSRIVVMTDTILRSSYTNSLSLASLGDLPKKAVVHVVEVTRDAAGGETYAERDDFHELAPVPLAHGGVFMYVQAGEEEGEAELREAALSLVRPVRIDSFEIAGGDGALEGIGAPETLEEGVGLRWMQIVEGAPAFVKLKGRIWAEPFVKVVPADPALGEKVVPALLFGTDLHIDLDETEMMKAAASGGAVSPVTSYLSIEPGTRPSKAGFQEEGGGGSGSGSGSLGAIGKGGGGLIGIGGAMEDPYIETMKKLARDASAACFAGGKGAGSVGVRIETTYEEVVDVAAGGVAPAPVKACVEEALWTIELPPLFTELRYEASFDLP